MAVGRISIAEFISNRFNLSPFTKDYRDIGSLNAIFFSFFAGLSEPSKF
jgi:hypothetical protein